MAVAKRQKRENSAKIEQRKFRGLESGPQVEQTALLASPIYRGQPQGGGKKHTKRGVKGPGPPSLRVFGSTCPHASRMYFPVIF